MAHINFDKQNSRKRGWKGFCLALAVCLVAVGGVAAATFMNTPDLAKEGSSTPTTKAPTEAVENIVTNVPDDRTATTTTRPTTTTATTTAGSTTTTAGEPADLFILPLTNEVIQEYSDGKPVYSKTMNDWRVHNGVDIACENGGQVCAIGDGKVAKVFHDQQTGYCITIDHGNGVVSTVRGLMENATVKEGDTVKMGAVIGGGGNTMAVESKMEPHIHLEVTKDEELIDPATLISQIQS